MLGVELGVLLLALGIVRAGVVAWESGRRRAATPHPDGRQLAARAPALNADDPTAGPEASKVLVRARPEAGRFQSVDETVVEALRLLEAGEEPSASPRDEPHGRLRNGA